MQHLKHKTFTITTSKIVKGEDDDHQTFGVSDGKPKITIKNNIC